jgi:hypothetical protein
VSFTCEELEPRIGPAVVTPVHTLQNTDQLNFSFGYSVAMSGNYVLVGAPGATAYAGAAYLYDTAGHLLHTFRDPNPGPNGFGGQWRCRAPIF